MLYLKADTITEITIGPAVAVGDGFTPVTTLTIAGADEAHLMKHNNTTAVALAGTLAVFSTPAVDGYYTLDLSATETDTEGRLVIVINDDSLILPIRHEFMIVNANVFDSMFAVVGTDQLQVDVVEQVGTTVPTPGVTGVPDVNVTHFVDELAPAPITTGVPDVNTVRILDVAPTLTNNDLDVNIAQIIGTAPTLTSTNIDVNVATHDAAALTAIEDEIWDALKSAHTTPNSFGDFLDIEVSSRSDPATAQTITANQAVNVAQWLGNGVAAATSGIPDVNAVRWNNGLIPAQGITGVPEVDVTHFVAELAPAPIITGVPDVNTVRILDVAPTLTNSDLDVNVAQIVGTAPTLTSTNIDVNVSTMAANSIAAGTIASGELTNIEDEIWDAPKSAHAVANSFGDFLDIEVSGRLASADINLTGGAVDTVTTVTNDVGLTAAAVNLIWDEAMTETSGAPAVTASFREAIKWLFALSRNKILQTATLTTLRNDADGADLATSAVTDDATTYTRNEWSA